MTTKISWILLGLGLSCGVMYAAHGAETPMPASNDINVTAPEQSGTWSFGATAVLMQPTNQAFTYADIELNDGTPNDLGGTEYADDFQNVNQSYHWWFGADITYAFPGNGRDVTLAYEGLQGDDTAHAPDAIPGVSTIYTISFLNGVDTASGESRTRYDAADLVFGQKLDMGERLRLHPFAGVRYAYINLTNSDNDTANYMAPTRYVTFQDTWESTFSGIGPRLGSDAALNLGQGFSVRARLGLSALIGTSSPKYNWAAYNTDAGVTTEDTFVGTHPSNTHVVPEIDGRLGLNYTYDFDSSMALGVEAGWQVTNYFNGVSMIEPPIDVSSVSSSVVNNSNFGVQGPYARLQLDIA